jgi:hypothetical protein
LQLKRNLRIDLVGAHKKVERRRYAADDHRVPLNAVGSGIAAGFAVIAARFRPNIATMVPGATAAELME